MSNTTSRKGLTSRTIQNLIEANQSGLFAHKHGLALSISKSGTATWAFRYTSPTSGGRRLMTLEAAIVTETSDLKAIEAQAIILKRMVKAGTDPLANRESHQKKNCQKRLDDYNFEASARRFIIEQSPNWKNDKHKAQWEATLETYVYKTVGTKMPYEITTQDVLDILRQPYKGISFWDGARETASRVRMRIETVLNAEFALNRDNPKQRDNWINFRNPAQWKNHLQVVFKSSGKKNKGHFEAMPFLKCPDFITELQKKNEYSAKALLLTILCATRTNETLGAKWNEINFDEVIWTIPPERMKAGIQHRIPLSTIALQFLKDLPRMDGNPYIFPGLKKGLPLSNMSMLMLLRGMRESESLTVHGFRSSFRDWAAETTLCPDILAEMALAHTIKDKTIAAYRRGDALERRAQLMQQWCDFLTDDPIAYKTNWNKFIV